MNVHKNAKMTPAGRVQAVRRVVQGESVPAVARGSGLSGRRLYAWVQRWQAGDRVLADRSSRPAVGRIAITSPLVYGPFAKGQTSTPYAARIKPFNFLLTAQVAPFGHIGLRCHRFLHRPCFGGNLRNNRHLKHGVVLFQCRRCPLPEH